MAHFSSTKGRCGELEGHVTPYYRIPLHYLQTCSSFSIYSQQGLSFPKGSELDNGLGYCQTVFYSEGHLIIEVSWTWIKLTRWAILSRSGSSSGCISKHHLMHLSQWWITSTPFFTSIIAIILERSLMNIKSSLIQKYDFPCLELLVKDPLKVCPFLWWWRQYFVCPFLQWLGQHFISF